MNDMNKALENLANTMVIDYALWQVNRINPFPKAHNEEMLGRYKSSLDFRIGKKYIKIIKEGSVAGFIVNVKDDPKFEYGTMLKAANWSTPARNFSRGNIFNNKDVMKVEWTGIR